jgi:hypothetical protein
MLKIIKSKVVSIVFLILGGVFGLLYWKFVGCSTGTCPITSHWYASTLYGMLMGWLIGDMISTFIRKKPTA